MNGWHLAVVTLSAVSIGGWLYAIDTLLRCKRAERQRDEALEAAQKALDGWKGAMTAHAETALAWAKEKGAQV